MATVIVHATVTLDGFMAGPNGEVDWMSDVAVAPEDETHVNDVVARIGAVVGGANRTRTIDDAEEPYGGLAGVPVFLLAHEPADPIEKNGVTYSFVVEDVARALELARDAAGDRLVSVLGGKVSRQALRLGLVDELHLDVVPILLGDGIPLFTGLGQRIDLERAHTSAFADEAHLVYRVRR